MNAPAGSSRFTVLAGSAIGAILLGGMLFGFALLPIIQGRQAGIDAWTAFCRSLGIGPGTPAASSPADTAAPRPVSDVAWTGATLAALAGAAPAAPPEAAQQCASCHGEKGIAIDPAFPNLAGQSAAAIFKQLHDYRSGARAHDVMTPMAQGLAEEDLAPLAVHFASQPKGSLDVTARADRNLPVADLVFRGDPARGIPACQACHGARSGGPIETPTLSRQNEAYLADQLRRYASGERGNDIYGRMRGFAAKLTEDEIKRLAAFYAWTE